MQYGNVSEPVSARVSCTKDLSSKVEVLAIEGGSQSSVVLSKVVKCNDSGFIEIGLVPKAGSYLVKAVLDVPSRYCSRCEIRKFIAIGQSVDFGIPDNNMTIAITAVILVFVLLNR